MREMPENTRDYRSSSAGFLKSRVYAKLLTGLILKCYQTFNGQPRGLWATNLIAAALGISFLIGLYSMKSACNWSIFIHFRPPMPPGGYTPHLVLSSDFSFFDVFFQVL